MRTSCISDPLKHAEAAGSATRNGTCDQKCVLLDSQVKTIDERAIATQAKLEALQEEHIKIKADLEFEKEAASEVGGTFGQLPYVASQLLSKG